MSDDIELTSTSEVEAWLNEPAVGVCNRCGRKTWAPDEVGAEDRMTQPDGNPCGGRFVAKMGDIQVTTVRTAIRAEMDRQEIYDWRPPGGFVNNYDQQKIAEAVVAALDAT